MQGTIVTVVVEVGQQVEIGQPIVVLEAMKMENEIAGEKAGTVKEIRVSPGDTVPDFEQAMNRLKPGEMSAPVRTPFGWHLLQVLERREQDVSKDRTRDQARLALRQRKSDEQFQEFVRQTRDRAYVEIKAEER